MSEGSTSSDNPQGYHHRFLGLTFDKSSDSEGDHQNDHRSTQRADIGDTFDASIIIEESVSSDETQGYRRRFFDLHITSSSTSAIEKSPTGLEIQSDSSFMLNEESDHRSSTNTGGNNNNADSQEDECIPDKPHQMSILGQQELSST